MRMWCSENDDGDDDPLPVHKSPRHRVRHDTIRRARSLCHLQGDKTFTSNRTTASGNGGYSDRLFVATLFTVA